MEKQKATLIQKQRTKYKVPKGETFKQKLNKGPEDKQESNQGNKKCYNEKSKKAQKVEMEDQQRRNTIHIT